MKPLNHAKRKTSKRHFYFVFGVTILLLFGSGFFAISQAQKGVAILEENHANYNKIFERQANITFALEDIIKKLYQLKNNERSLGEHRQFQSLLSDLRINILKDMEVHKVQHSDAYSVYEELLAQVKTIQAMLDKYEEESEEYHYNKELLEKCREKYQEDMVGASS